MSDKYLLIDEAAAYVRLSKETLYKYVQRGLIPAAKIGRHWRFDKDAIDAWVAARTHSSPPPDQPVPSQEAARPAPPLETSRPVPTPETPRIGRRLRVLVVDDDAAVRMILEKWIRVENHDVDLSKNGADAVERLTKTKYDLVFLDLQMPELTGDQVLGRLKEYDVHPPVVLITGFTETSLMVQALNYDLLYVLTKPFERKQVQQLLLSVQAPIPYQTSGLIPPNKKS